jgi:hypothetical protein
MAHHPAIERLKIGSREKELASSFLRAFRHQGLPASQALKIIQWASTTQGDLVEAFQQEADRRGWPEQIRDAGLTWHSTVAERGPDAILPLPPLPAAEIAARLAEVRHIRQNSPDRYEADRDLHDYELELMQMAAEATQPAAQAPPPSNIYSPAPEQPAMSLRAASARLAEMRSMYRSDPDRWERNKEFEAEQIALNAALRQPDQPASAAQSNQFGQAASAEPASPADVGANTGDV